MVQLVPLLVERKTPPAVPTKRFVPLVVRALTVVFVKPVLTCVQLMPLSVDKKTPLVVPAKRFVPETAKQLTVPLLGTMV
jgi:hypothetical protein